MTLPSADTAAYLRGLRVDHPGPPSAERLRALHAAHVERIPYEVLDIQLRRHGLPSSALDVAVPIAASASARSSAMRSIPSTTLDTRGAWFGALRDVFDLPLADVGAAERDVLWRRVCDAHETWRSARAAS